MPTIDLVGFPKRLRDTRKKHRKYSTQQKLGDAFPSSLYKDKDTISAWENGKRYPTLSEIQILADLLECDLGYLFGWQGDQLRLEIHTPEYWLGFLEGTLRRERPVSGEQIERMYWDSLVGYDSRALQVIDHHWQSIQSFLEGLENGSHPETLIHALSLLMHYFTNRLRFADRVKYSKLARDNAQSLENKYFADPERREAWRKARLLFTIDGLAWVYIETGDSAIAVPLLKAALREAERYQYPRLAALAKIFLARANWRVDSNEDTLSLVDALILETDHLIRARYFLVRAEIAIALREYHSAVRYLKESLKSYRISKEGNYNVFVMLGLAYMGLARTNAETGNWIEKARRCIAFVTTKAAPSDFRWAEYARLLLRQMEGENRTSLIEEAGALAEKIRKGGRDDELGANLAPVSSHDLLTALRKFVEDEPLG